MGHHLRSEPGGLHPEEFRRIGHDLIDILADFFGSINDGLVTGNERQADIRGLLQPRDLPPDSSDAGALLRDTAEKMIRHSLHNGHPRFWGYITSSADPVGVLGDLIASAVNANVGLWSLSPMASEIELQAIRWIAELIDFPTDCGGILVSGGNMANFVCFLAARRAKAAWEIQRLGSHGGPKLIAYVSTEAHTWVDKAFDLFGLGSDNLRWIEVDDDLKMRVDKLDECISSDLAAGYLPAIVVGTAGSVSTGTIDPLIKIADLCHRRNLWFHVDGAYGAFAAALPDAADDFRAFQRADSIAVDPHKWLYAPLEAGCALVRNPADLERAFSHKAFYLNKDGVADDQPVHFVDRGMQNSRGFRALKVWLGLKAAGKAGIVRSISEDVELSRRMAQQLKKRSDFEVTSQCLSITTFRYVPAGIDPVTNGQYLDDLNGRILHELQAGGRAFVSHARVRGVYVLRACIVNFRTTAADVDALPQIVAEIGQSMHQEMGRSEEV